VSEVPIVVTVAGSDPSGGAGLQADLRVFALHGLHGCGVVTALTVQNSAGVTRVEAVDADLVADQLLALLADGPPAALKLGMLGTTDVAAAVGAALATIPTTPAVVDPVLMSSSGAALFEGAPAAYRDHLFARAALVTPNHDEAAALLGLPVGDVAADPTAAAVALSREVPTLLTGGHAAGPPTDVLAVAGDVVRFGGARVAAASSHGTGCLLSAGIAAGLARGMELRAAVAHGKACVEDGLRHALRTGVRLTTVP